MFATLRHVALASLFLPGFVLCATDSMASDADSAESDQTPYENVVDKDAATSHWAISLSTGRSWTHRDTFSTSQTAVLSRSFTLDPVDITPRVGIWHQSSRPDQATYSTASAGASADWSASDDHSFSLDGLWTTEEGPDSWESTLSWSFDHEVTDWFSLQAGAWAGWSKFQRGSSGGSLDGDLTAGAFSFSAGASYTRRLETYSDIYGEDKSAYINAYGSSANLSWSRGKWSMGPSWEGEIWTANTSGIPPSLKGGKGSKSELEKLAQKAAKIPVNGVVVNNTFGWYTAWKMFPGMRLSMGLSKGYGSSHTTVNANRPQVQAALSRQGQDPTIDSDSFGASLGYAFSW